jgi:hypothetical protein
MLVTIVVDPSGHPKGRFRGKWLDSWPIRLLLGSVPQCELASCRAILSWWPDLSSQRAGGSCRGLMWSTHLGTQRVDLGGKWLDSWPGRRQTPMSWAAGNRQWASGASPTRHRPVTDPSPSRHRPVTVPSPSRHRPVTALRGATGSGWAAGNGQWASGASPTRHRPVTATSRHRPVTVPSPSRHRPVTVPSPSRHRPVTVPSPSALLRRIIWDHLGLS